MWYLFIKFVLGKKKILTAAPMLPADDNENYVEHSPFRVKNEANFSVLWIASDEDIRSTQLTRKLFRQTAYGGKAVEFILRIDGEGDKKSLLPSSIHIHF